MTPDTTETIETTGRTLGVVLPAAAVTVGLLALMAGLIAEEFQPEDKVEIAELDINPRVEDIVVAERTVEFQELQRVETPPPPPAADAPKAEKPSEPVVEITGARPDFERPTLDPTAFDIVIGDRKAQPLVRIPPQMPPRAEKSGHCKVRFNVSPEGQPFDVQATYCTERMFESPSVRSVQKWKYNPKIQDGRPVGRSGVESKITFKLADERGNIIPE